METTELPEANWGALYAAQRRRPTPTGLQPLKAGSLKVYGAMWHRFAVELAGRGLLPSQAARREVVAFLMADARSKTHDRYRDFLVAVYDWAMGQKLATSNPARGITRGDPSPLNPTVLPDFTPESLVAKLPPPRDWQHHRDQAITISAVCAGLRLQELRELRHAFVKERSSGAVQIMPAGSKDKKDKDGRQLKPRSVDVVGAPAARLRAWLAHSRQLPFETELVFPAEGGEVLEASTLYRRCKEILRQDLGLADLPRYGLGILRSTFAKHMLENRELPEAQRALGHRRRMSTARLKAELAKV